MLECVNGNGQGICALCFLTKGFHREWSSHLYYVVNPHGLYLRYHDAWGAHFSDNADLRKLAFCHLHACAVDNVRVHLVDWERGCKNENM